MILRQPSFLGVYIISKKVLLTVMISCGTIIGVAWAEETLPMIQFSIKPRLCVLSEGEEICHDELELKWVSRTRRSLCLYRSDAELAMQCWDNTFSGEHHLEISASRNVDFQLKESENLGLVVTEAFEVVHDNTKFRKRRRNAWSFF